MKLKYPKKLSIAALTLVEMSVAMGIGTAILAGFTTASIALQRTMVAVEDYSKGQNDQMRISDYLSLDMRRAFQVLTSTDPVTGVLTVTLTEPNYYASADTPYNPYIIPTTGWPFKKHHHHKHQNIIINEIVSYGPYDASQLPANRVTAPTITVTYVFDNGAYTLTRSVNGGTGTVIASDVKDFNVTISDVDETATTQITFNPRFKSVLSAAAVAGTTYYQTTLTRNTR